MRKRPIVIFTVLLIFSLVVSQKSQATLVYADQVTHLLRGDTTVGDFTGFYGGDVNGGGFPVELTIAEAKAAVLGPSDGVFLSLPGRDDTPTGSGFLYTYVEVAFSELFDHYDEVIIHELGNNLESAQIWLWFENGGNLQLQLTRGANSFLSIDLSAYEGLINTYGRFSKIGIGGLDELGASKGFDLDSVAISVPEPGVIFLFVLALFFPLYRRYTS